mmetsp:Transcript_5999/g.18938  ORF Transcript_5999/g.18938 Transcript_5999/m.18938 type:complete len:233 (+) Transcript_5999:579-1277(+)
MAHRDAVPGRPAQRAAHGHVAAARGPWLPRQQPRGGPHRHRRHATACDPAALRPHGPRQLRHVVPRFRRRSDGTRGALARRLVLPRLPARLGQGRVQPAVGAHLRRGRAPRRVLAPVHGLLRSQACRQRQALAHFASPVNPSSLASEARPCSATNTVQRLRSSYLGTVEPSLCHCPSLCGTALPPPLSIRTILLRGRGNLRCAPRIPTRIGRPLTPVPSWDISCFTGRRYTT